MNTRWHPIVHSATCVEIPVIVVKHSAKAHDQWKAAQGPWERSSYTDASAFGRYAALARTGRFRFPKGKQSPYKFGEFHAALLLHRQGFTCWSAVQLFDHRNPKKGFWKANTDEVREKFKNTGFRWPGDVQPTLAFLPKTPDIVAYHPRRGWLFCEVKRPNDRIKIDQVRALAVLHLLTGAPVAIIRVVPMGGRTTWKPSLAEIAYRRSAHGAPWILTSDKNPYRASRN